MKFKKILVIALVAFALLLPMKALAVECGVLPQSLCDSIINPTGPVDSPAAPLMPLINFITNILLVLFGSVIVLIIIISGVQIAASAGNEDVVKKGKENIFKAVTGLVLLISFRAILSLINRVFEGVDTGVLFVSDSSTGELAGGGIPLLLSNSISLASSLAAIVSVIFIIVGGVQYASSAGGEGVKKAKKTITYALMGLVISISAYAILIFIQEQLQK